MEIVKGIGQKIFKRKDIPSANKKSPLSIWLLLGEKRGKCHGFAQFTREKPSAIMTSAKWLEGMREMEGCQGVRLENDLGRDPVRRLVLRIAIPSMLAQLVSVLYGIVDRV